VPTKRALKFGLKKENSYSFFYLMLPFLALWKISKGSTWSTKLLHRTMDYYMSLFMKPCDVYIALGTVYTRSITSAKKKHNALTILEWGSMHILEQELAITRYTLAKKQPPYSVSRSLLGYTLADYISIPSTHVFKSFVLNEISPDKLIINPYGVDLNMFPPTELNKESNYDALMVGNWSYTKGCDLISDYFATSNKTFLHVGSIKDLPFPQSANMTHIDHVDQSELQKYYAKAKVFILPSRAEGLAMVQCQAIACGLPIVCSSLTGGIDLRNLLDDQKWIIEMPEYSIPSLHKSLENAITLSEMQDGIRNYAKQDLKNLSWQAYGERYHSFLSNLAIS
jgi:glycosyltransferase involved in cell wall biosynthesis